MSNTAKIKLFLIRWGYQFQVLAEGTIHALWLNGIRFSTSIRILLLSIMLTVNKVMNKCIK